MIPLLEEIDDIFFYTILKPFMFLKPNRPQLNISPPNSILVIDNKP